MKNIDDKIIELKQECLTIAKHMARLEKNRELDDHTKEHFDNILSQKNREISHLDNAKAQIEQAHLIRQARKENLGM